MHTRWSRFLLTITAFCLPLAGIAPAQTNHESQPPDKTSQSGKVVLYAAVGPELTRYEVDVNGAALTKRETIALPANVQEVAVHPTRRFLYIAWSNGGPSNISPSQPIPSGSLHGLSAFRVDPASGALLPHGQPASLPSRPIHVTTDIPGTHVLAAYNDPSGITVHQINADGTLALLQVHQPQKLDVGVYGHQVRVDPSNEMVILVTRGNGPTATKAEDPGALKLFSYKDGVLTNWLSIAPGGGFNFQVRHLDFHPSRRWVYVSLERQDKLEVYGKQKDGTLGRTPLFTKDTLNDPGNVRPGQALGTIHMHPSGKFVYLANRASGTVDFQGKPVFGGGENSIAVFAINQQTGEPTRIQNMDTHGIHVRTFALDPSGKILVAGNMMELPVRDKDGVRTVPASLAVFRIGNDGKLEFVRKYDLSVGGRNLFWMGMLGLP
ncbi:MAG TPA: beta-propeller fold lactonase family protein [Candidatus Acidoferrales bacterium]|nr:beta-propeller fold lactonase family protein [Candidatus Acidoferrales bacterium]